VNSFKSMGTHALIQEGAKLVTHVGDILEEIGRPAAGAASGAHGGHPAALPHPLPGLPPEEQAIVAALGPYPVHIDHLVRQLGLAPGLLAGILLRLELKGFVQQHPGDHYSQTARCLEDR
jgi:DNA processing protein